MPLDIGVGLALGVLLNHLSGLSYGLCLSIGVAATLLPDLDFMWTLVRTRRIPHTEHRDGLHYPLLLIPAAGLVGWAFRPSIGLTMALGVLAHMVHDSFGIGYGIKWLFPFKKNSYMFLYHANVGTNAAMPKQKFYSWSDAERTEAIKRYANPHWIREIYFRPHPFGIFEYGAFLIGLTTAIIHP